MTKPQSTDIGSKKLMELLSTCRNHQADMDTLRDGTKDVLSKAAEIYGLDKKVFSLIRRLDKMSPGDLADWKETFDDYWLKGGLQRRAESAPRLPLEERQTEPEEPAEAAAEKPKRGCKPKNGGAEGEEGSAGLPH